MPKKHDRQRLLEDLKRYLGEVRSATAASACGHLGISQPAFSRLVAEAGDDLLVVGRARATRYAARRSIPSVGRKVPIYEVGDGSTQAREIATLHAIQPGGFYLEARTGEAASGYFDDLPYFLHDLRPSGFLGRLIPRRHPELELPQDVRFWTADHCLKYLTRHGWNLPGNLVLGDEAFRLFLAHTREPPDLVAVDERSRIYPAWADDVLAAGVIGSSAGGEHPKFLAVRGPDLQPVLVKFSPPVQDDISQRLADLLVCEHIAHHVLGAHGKPAAKSELVTAAGRVFLEVERFDRIGVRGRLGLLPLTALDAEFVGRMGGWSDTVAELVNQKHLDEDDYRGTRWLELFGHLIANSDMHPGNLSFFTRGTRIEGLAPAYDMLPMMYAPQHGQLVDRAFNPPLPAPPDADIWSEVRMAAADFWTKVQSHTLVSEGFRRIAGVNGEAIASLRDVEGMLPKP